MKGAIRCDLSTKSEIFSSCKLFSSDTQDRRTEKCSSWLLRRFQRRGNPIIVVLGDFTSQGQKDAQGSDTTVVCTLCSLLFLGKVSGLCAQFGKVSVLCAQFGKSVSFMCPVWEKCQLYLPIYPQLVPPQSLTPKTKLCDNQFYMRCVKRYFLCANRWLR